SERRTQCCFPPIAGTTPSPRASPSTGRRSKGGPECSSPICSCGRSPARSRTSATAPVGPSVTSSPCPGRRGWQTHEPRSRTSCLANPRPARKDGRDRLGEVARARGATAELECYALTAAGEPVDHGFYFDDVEGPGAVVVRDAADLLRAHGVLVLSCHHEAGPGQYELDLAALGPLELADALVTAKQAIRQQARAAGVQATFMPRPFEREAGSGLHLHQHFGDGFVTETGKLDDDGRAVVGGLLEHSGGLCAVAAPTVNSYKRLHGTDEAPGAAMWGH